MFQHPPGSGSAGRLFLKTETGQTSDIQPGGIAQYIPALNKIFETIGPADAVLRLILQLGDRLADNIGQEVDQTGARLHLSTVGREGEAMLCDFEQSYTERPNVRCDRV